MSLLAGIKGPNDLKKLDRRQLADLMAEVRGRIVEVTTRNGGHMASSLGAVEIVTALLRSFDPQNDKIIFDVGHQAYAWKILTDRNDRFDTLRRENGICGFPRMAESPYDCFGVGHSSTSLSAALGYALARDLRKEDHHVVAVIGDGALINGEAFEALNHAGSLNTRVMFVLNDNAMAISPRVGGMALHLARLSTSSLYKNMKTAIKTICRDFLRSDRAYRVLAGTKDKLKKAVTNGNLFNEMGLTYWGPFDGHDEEALERVFQLAKSYDRPLLIHVITKKGRGYKPAEDDPIAYHGVSPLESNSDAKSGSDSDAKSDAKPDARSGAKSSGITWSAAAADCIQRLAEKDSRYVVLTPAMTEGSALSGFKKRFPERFFDVGIAEEHMFTFAAGLAAGGMRPLACIYSTFMQRAFDQLVHDICLQNLPVTIAVDRAGLVGADGETHQGLFDMNWCSVVPNLQIWSPYDRASLETAFAASANCQKPFLIRYPRGTIPEKLLGGAQALDGFELSNSKSSWCVVSFGSACEIALGAVRLCEEKGLEPPQLIFLNRVKPLPEMVLNALEQKEIVIYVEENYRRGGLGEQLTVLSGEAGLRCEIKILALPPCYVAAGTVAQQRGRYGLTPERIVELYERENCKIQA